MVGDARERLGEVVVRLVDGLLLWVDRLHGQRAGAQRERAQGLGVLGVVGDDLGHDVLRALQRRLRRGEAGLGVHEPGRQGEGALVAAALRQDEQRKGLEACVACLRRTGGALLLERLVQVLHALHDLGRLDLRAQLGCELALLVDGVQHLGLAGLEVAQVGEALVEGAQLGVVHAAGGLLAVASDERDGVALVDKGDNGRDLRRGQAELARERGVDG